MKSKEKVAHLTTELENCQAATKKLKKKLEERGKADRYIANWFRVTSSNLYTRRQIVDTKSGFMITVNSIFISVLLGSLYTQLDNDPHLIWGLAPMIIANVASIFYAFFATRPKIAAGTFEKKDVENKTASLNSFDDFYNMPEKDYQWAVKEMTKDTDFIHNTYLKENHKMGVDLAKRYTFIRYSYHIFLVGVVISVTAFALCHLLF